MSLPIVFLALTGLINVYLAVIVLNKNPKNRSNLYFAAVAFCVAMWSFTMIMFKSSEHLDKVLFWGRLTHLFGGLIGFAFLIFSAYFPENKKKIGSVIIGFFGFLAIGVSVISMFGNIIIKEAVKINDTSVLLYSASGYPIFGGFLIGCFLVSYIVLYKKYKRSNGRAKLQLKYFGLGLLASTIIGIIFDVIITFNQDFRFNWIGPVASLIMIVAAFYAITRYRLMDIRFFIRKSMSVFVSLLIILIAGLLIREAVKPYLGESIILYSFLLILSPIFYIIIKNYSYAFLNKHFFASLYDLPLLSREISESLWRSRSAQEIGDSIARIFNDVFHVSKIALVEFGNAAESFKVVFNQGYKLNNEGEIFNAQLASLFSDKLEPIIAEEFINRHYLSLKNEDTVDWFQTVKPAILAPLADGEKVFGFLLIGKKETEDVFSREDLRVIKETARSASLAITIAKKDEDRERELKEMREFVNSLDAKEKEGILS